MDQQAEVPGYYHFLIIYLIGYLVLAVLDEHCGAGFSLVVASRGYSPVAVCGLLIATASLRKHRSKARGLRSCSSRVLGHRLNSCGAWA